MRVAHNIRKIFAMKKTLLITSIISILFLSNKIYSQDFTTQETVDYINSLISNPEYEFLVSNNNFEYRRYYKGRISTKRIIGINDISKIRTSTDRFIGVYADCYYENDCSSHYLPDGKPVAMPYFVMEIDDNNSAEKIANALRYLVEKEKKSSSNNDPFASYNVEKTDNRTININDLKVGMSKSKVFDVLNTKPVIELIESGYEVFRVKKQEQYFLYFSNNRLIRVDKGVSMVDAIIIIK